MTANESIKYKFQGTKRSLIIQKKKKGQTEDGNDINILIPWRTTCRE